MSEQYIDYLRDFIGREWLEAEFRKIETKSPLGEVGKHFSTYHPWVHYMYEIGKDYVMTDTLANVVNAFEQKDAVQEGFFLSGAKVVNSTGNTLGSVDDFSFDEKTGAILDITLDNGITFNQGGLIAFSGGDMVFVSESDAQSAPASSVDDEQRTFLLGKTIYEDVTDTAGNVIITSGTVIDESVIATAEAADAIMALIMSAQ